MAGRGSLDALPDLGSVEGADVAAHLELGTTIDRLQACAVALAVVRVDDGAALINGLVALALLDTAQDLQPEHGLVLAVVGALVAHGLLIGRGVEQLLDTTTEDAVALGD